MYPEVKISCKCVMFSKKKNVYFNIPTLVTLVLL